MDSRVSNDHPSWRPSVVLLKDENEQRKRDVDYLLDVQKSQLARADALIEEIVERRRVHDELVREFGQFKIEQREARSQWYREREELQSRIERLQELAALPSKTGASVCLRWGHRGTGGPNVEEALVLRHEFDDGNGSVTGGFRSSND